MSSPILKITNGSNTVDLLSRKSGLLLNDWNPAIAQLKGGGTYQQSVLSDGKQLVMANYDNAIESFTFKIHGSNQDTVIGSSQELLRLLGQARTYWFTPYQTDPVWLVARSPNETNTRYAIIHNYQQQGLDNPYAAPFFSCGGVVIDDVALIIERGHWANVAPTEGECIQIAGSSSELTVLESATIFALGQDTEADLGASGHTATTFLATRETVSVGRNISDVRSGISLWFSVGGIPSNAIINDAYINLVTQWDTDYQGNTDLIIYGDDEDAALAPISVATWNAKPLTAASVEWAGPKGFLINSTVIRTPNLASIIQEIIARPGWNGTTFQFFIEELNCDAGNEYHFASFENIFLDPASITVEYSVAEGQTAPTCLDQVYVVDKYHTTGIDHAYFFRSTVVWSINLANTVSWAPFLNAVGDKAYFGVDTTEPNTGPFNNITFNITPLDSGSLTIIWEYYQGAPTSAWKAFAATQIIDNTEGFSKTGFYSVSFTPPMDNTNGDWVTGDLHTLAAEGTGPSVTGYWIRARVSATSSPSGTVFINVSSSEPLLYTTTWPSVSYLAAQVAGDIPAIARVKLDSSGQNNTAPTVQHRAILAVSSDRGPYGENESYNFSAYLPCTDEQIPSVMDVPVVAGEHTFVNEITAPSGRCVQLAPSGTGSKSFYIEVNSLHFFGTYKAFVRARQIGGSDNHFKIKLSTQHDGTTYAETNEAGVTVQESTTLPNWQLLDLGLIDIPTGLPARSSDEGATIEIHIETEVIDATGDMMYMDVILMPTDEWIVDVQDIGVEGFSNGRDLHIDSVTVPKVDLRALVKSAVSVAAANPTPWKPLGSQMRLPSNIGGKLWFLSARWNGSEWISDGITTAKVQLFTAEQYLGLRGNR